MARSYIAFISYRHLPLDIAVAEELHKLIERYRIPRALRKSDSGKLGYVFRDRDELPVSSDLSHDIEEALDNSEFLIVVCTPGTPQSIWVKREIEYFLRHHDRNRILAVLADGEPNESFPPLLTHIYEPDGKTVAQEVEPLAANICGANQKETLSKLRGESLRLIAALMDCPYDELRQRERKHKQRRLTAFLSAAAAIALAFIGMLLAKNAEISTQYEKSLINESEALVSASERMLEDGDRRGAVESALKALPSTDNERPYLAEAERALASALYVYGERNKRFSCTIEQATFIRDIVVSSDGLFAATKDDNGYVRCFNALNGAMLWEKKLSENTSVSIEFINEQRAVLCVTLDCAYLLSAFEGEVIWKSAVDRFKNARLAAVSHDEKVFAINGYELVTGTCSFGFYNTRDGKLLADAQYTADAELIFEQGVFSEDDSVFFARLGTPIGIEGRRAYFAVDIDTSAVKTILDEPKSQYDKAEMALASDGDLVIVSTNGFSSDLWITLTKTSVDGGVRYSVTVPLSANFELISGFECLVNSERVMAARGRQVFAFDIISGEQLYETTLPGTPLAAFWFSEENSLAEFVLDSGIVTTVLDDGTVSYDAQTYFTFDDIINTAVGLTDDTYIVAAQSFSAANKAAIVRLLGDPNARAPFAAEIQQYAYVFALSPSGKKLLHIRNEYDTGKRLGSILDAETKENIYSFEIEYKTDYDFLGFSEDETKLIFKGFVYDTALGKTMKSESFYEYSSHADTMAHTGGADGGPVVEAYITEEWRQQDELILKWRIDAGMISESLCPFVDKWYSDINPYSSLFAGDNGYIVAKLCESEENGSDEFFAAFSWRGEEWSRIDNVCAERGKSDVRLAKTLPIFASADPDNHLRVYDITTGELICDIALGFSVDAIQDFAFCRSDGVIVISRDDNMLLLFDVTDSRELLSVQGAGVYVPLMTTEAPSPEGDTLYISDTKASSLGIAVDIKSWKVKAVIPRPICYLPITDEIITYHTSVYDPNTYTVYPRYSLNDLTEMGKAFLEMREPV